MVHQCSVDKAELGDKEFGKCWKDFVDLLNLQFSRLTKPTGLTRLTR
jgi:hypothetical protein